ncbi:MAG: DUF2147 domain-containing protein [Candidatus Sulfomarinibacteraceae bacterium]
MQRPAMLLAGVMLLLAGSAVAQDGDAILGLWATDPEGGGGEAHVRIYKEDGKYFGKIVWLAEPVYPDDDPKGTPGEEKTDLNNPDPDLRGEPVIGLLITKDFVYNGDGLWHKGTIYDPDNGKTYKCKIRYGDSDKVLKVRGFIGISMLGRTTYWTRVEDDE